MHSVVARVTARIIERSAGTRAAYLAGVEAMIQRNPLSPLSLAMKTARHEGKLLAFLGGVMQTPLADVPTGFIYRA